MPQKTSIIIVNDTKIMGEFPTGIIQKKREISIDITKDPEDPTVEHIMITIESDDMEAVNTAFFHMGTVVGSIQLKNALIRARKL